MICKHCDQRIPNDSEYCPFCGLKVSNKKALNNIVTHSPKAKQNSSKSTVLKTIVVGIFVLFVLESCVKSTNSRNHNSDDDIPSSVTRSTSSYVTSSPEEKSEISQTTNVTTEKTSKETVVTENATSTTSDESEVTASNKVNGIIFNIKDVPKDATGNWRISCISEDIDMVKYAVEYYNTYFKDDGEIHAIVNEHNNTTTSISSLIAGYALRVDVYEHIKNEEKNAKDLFSGELIEEWMIVIDTGEATKLYPSETASEPNEISEVKPESSLTTGQKNALERAKDYLNFMPFSYDGLISQLEFDGYDNKDAVFAVDNCGADWNEQAVLKAKSYLDYSAFSYSGLVDQLEYEDFTREQAEYGADNCGADWNEQAVLKAESYLEYSAFSYSGLVDQLEFEEFTHEQAKYGVDNCGADWNEQAVLMAESYLEYSAFSYDELISQLEYEGFSREQAIYGAEQNGY